MDLPPGEPGRAPREELPPAEPAADEPAATAEPGAEPEATDQPARDPEAAAPSDEIGQPNAAGMDHRLARVVRGRRRPLLAAGFAAILVLSLAGGWVALSPGSSPGGSSGVTAAASESAFASETSVATGSPSNDVAPTPAPTRTPFESLPAQTAPTADITFNQLVLDANANGTGRPTTLTFVSDGPGLVSVSIVASSPTDATRVCLSGDGGPPICATGATPGATFYGRSSQSRWSATLESAGANPPTIDVEVRWPANKPSIGVAHSPFEGEPNRDSLRSLTATVTAKSSGEFGLEASWAPVALAASLTVWRVDAGGRAQVDHASVQAAQSIAPAHATQLEAGATYVLTLINLSPVGQSVDLNATIAFP